jgi:hypothetical protein
MCLLLYNPNPEPSPIGFIQPENLSTPSTALRLGVEIRTGFIDRLLVGRAGFVDRVSVNG